MRVIRRIHAIAFPTGEHAGQLADVLRRVTVDGLAVAQARRAVCVQLDQADAEQLHDLAGIVLVGHSTGACVFLAVAQHVQVTAHAHAERHILQKLSVGAKGIFLQQIGVVGDAQASPFDGQTLHGHHKNLGQGQRHALPNGVGTAHELEPNGVISPREVCPVGIYGIAVGDHPVVARDVLHRQGQLRIQPIGKARGFDRCNRFGRCRKPRLAQEAGSLCVGRRGSRTAPTSTATGAASSARSQEHAARSQGAALEGVSGQARSVR